eukprot:symbB.v1.2.008745.t2/scaffold544.1/size189386/2
MPSMLALHLVLLNVLNVVQTLRDHEVMPLISNDINDETVPGSEVASHLELRETKPPDVHVADDVDGKHLEQSFRELEVTEELLAKAKEAKELQGDDLCSNGTWHLSGDFKVTQERLWIGKPCNITAHGVTLFLKHNIGFHDTVHFHGDLAVVAVRRPLRDPCVFLGCDAFVEPGAVLRLAGCQNANDRHGPPGGAMYVYDSLDVRGQLHVRDSNAREGGAIFVQEGSFTQLGGTLTITNASAPRGGAIYVKEGSFTQLGGNLRITDASAESGGGAMWIGGNLTMKKNKLSITHATAKIGGGIWVGGDGLFEDAVASFDQCHALEDGGTHCMSGNPLLAELQALRQELAALSSRVLQLEEQVGGHRSGGGSLFASPSPAPVTVNSVGSPLAELPPFPNLDSSNLSLPRPSTQSPAIVPIANPTEEERIRAAIEIGEFLARCLLGTNRGSSAPGSLWLLGSTWWCAILKAECSIQCMLLLAIVELCLELDGEPRRILHLAHSELAEMDIQMPTAEFLYGLLQDPQEMLRQQRLYFGGNVPCVQMPRDQAIITSLLTACPGHSSLKPLRFDHWTCALSLSTFAIGKAPLCKGFLLLIFIELRSIQGRCRSSRSTSAGAVFTNALARLFEAWSSCGTANIRAASTERICETSSSK